MVVSLRIAETINKGGPGHSTLPLFQSNAQLNYYDMSAGTTVMVSNGDDHSLNVASPIHIGVAIHIATSIFMACLANFGGALGAEPR
jgi:hypothetical protein